MRRRIVERRNTRNGQTVVALEMCTFFEEALVRVFGGDAVGVDLLEGRGGSRRFCFGGARLRLRLWGRDGRRGAAADLRDAAERQLREVLLLLPFGAAAGFFLGAGRGFAWRMGTSSSGTNSSSLSSIIILSRCLCLARGGGVGRALLCVGDGALQLALASRSDAKRSARMNYVSTAVQPVTSQSPRHSSRAATPVLQSSYL